MPPQRVENDFYQTYGTFFGFVFYFFYFMSCVFFSCLFFCFFIVPKCIVCNEKLWRYVISYRFSSSDADGGGSFSWFNIKHKFKVKYNLLQFKFFFCVVHVICSWMFSYLKVKKRRKKNVKKRKNMGINEINSILLAIHNRIKSNKNVSEFGISFGRRKKKQEKWYSFKSKSKIAHHKPVFFFFFGKRWRFFYSFLTRQIRHRRRTQIHAKDKWKELQKEMWTTTFFVEDFFFFFISYFYSTKSYITTVTRHNIKLITITIHWHRKSRFFVLQQ